MSEVLGLPTIYIENPGKVLKGAFLSDEDYGKAIAALPPVCADAVIINKTRRSIYLAPRISHPAPGWWVIGGRVKFEQSIPQGIVSNFKRETTLDLPFERFTYLCANHYFWATRAQEPMDFGTVVIAYAFTVELSDEELKRVSGNLEKQEYRGKLREFFSLQDLAETGARPPLIDMYKQVFGG